MNNSINYSGYVDMLLDSSDEFEPYGYSIPPRIVAQASGFTEANLMLHLDSMCDDPWEE